MPPSSSRRAQAEPLAAIVAVTTFAAALGIYAVFLADVPLTDERDLAEPTAEHVWQEVSTADVYRADGAPPLGSRIDHEHLPDGHYAYVRITAYTQAGQQVFAEGYFDPQGDPLADTDGLPPEETQVHERSVSVAIEQGRIRGGTLHVEVWG